MRKIILLYCLFLIVSCNNEQRKNVVVNSENKERYPAIEKMKLDEHYNNLLSPEFSSKEEYTEVAKTWNDFHQQIGKIVKAHNFDWGVKDSTITVLNRIYFNKNGAVDYYTFRVSNKNVSEAKKAEYENLLSENISKIKINLKREKQFAQCGKVRYQNK